MSILNQNLLTLDFWKDEVTYAGHTLPTGSIGCAAMNITDEQIGQLVQLAIPLAAVVELIKDGTSTAEHFTVTKESILQITHMMRTTYPFSLFDFPDDGHDIQQIFSDEYIENAIAYIKAAQEIGMAAVFDEQYKNEPFLREWTAKIAKKRNESHFFVVFKTPAFIPRSA